MAEIIKTSIDVDINTSGAAAELRRLQQQINAFNLTLNRNQKTQGQASKVWAESLASAVNRTGMFRAEMVKMQTSAAALDSTLRKGQATLGQFFSAAFNKRSAMAAETFALAAERARTMQTQFIATGKSAKGMQEALAIRPLSAFSSELAVSTQRMQILSSMFRQGTTQLINFGKNVQWAGRQLMVGFTVPLTIFGSTAGRVFRDLEMQSVAFRKVYGDIFTTPKELQDNLKAVEGLSKEFTKYGVAVKDTMSLAAQAAAAGRRNGELTDAVTESTRLATLGQMDQNAALETTIALQSAFRLSGQELSNTINYLNMVENQTVVSLQDIASAIPRVAPVIQGLGGDVKDLTVFLAAMQEGGVSAEQGANALKSGLGSLINPSKEASEQLGALGINIKSIVQQNQGDLMGIVTTFSKALSTLGEFQQQQVLETLFGKYQYARLGALFENIIRDGSQAQQVIATMGYTTEQLAASAEKELKVVEQAFSVQLIAAVERLKLAIAPIGQLFVKMAIPIVNFLTKIVEWFNRLPDGVKNFTALATVITGVLIPAATMLFGLFSNLIGTLAKMTQGIGLFGVTLVKRGPIAAIKTLTQSSKYLSLSEIDAANAAQQLGSATAVANQALLQQITTAGNTKLAIDNLTASYQRLIGEQMRAADAQMLYFGPGKTASNISRGRIQRRNQGGPIVPGVGSTDTVPAMLTPGEFVVNKQATRNNLGLLQRINGMNQGGIAGGIQYLNDGGIVFASQTAEKVYNAMRSSLASDPKGLAMFDQEIENIITVNEQRLLKERGKGERLLKTQKPGILEAVQALSEKTNSKTYMEAYSIISKSNILAEKSHISGKSHVGNWPIIGANGKFIIPKNVPVELTNDKTLNIGANLNKRLGLGSVPAQEMLSYFQANEEVLFNKLDSQFETFRNSGDLGLEPQQRSELLDKWKNAKKTIYQSFTSQLADLAEKGAVLTDTGTGGSIKLQDLADDAFKALKDSGSELSIFDELISEFKYVRMGHKNNLVKQVVQQGLMTAQQAEGIGREGLFKRLILANADNPNDPRIKKALEIFTLQSAEGTMDINDFASSSGRKLPSSVVTYAKLLSRLRWKPGKAIMANPSFANKGGMIGKAIFERGKVGIPKLMNLSGLAKNGEDVVANLVNGGMGVDDAIKFAKLTQTGYLKTGIPTGPVRNIEDYIKRKIDFEKSQGSMNYSLYKKFYGLRHKPKSEQQKIIDEYNKLYWGDMGPAMYNKGGNVVPGVGSTDTVPAMLTPGEFVVNKQATRNNLGLLHAINAQKLNVGGKVKNGMLYAQNGLEINDPVISAINRGVAGPVSQLGGAATKSIRGAGFASGAAGMIAGSLPFMFGNMGSVSSLATSLIASTAATKLVSIGFKKMAGQNVKLLEEFNILGKVAKIFGSRLALGFGIGGVAVSLGIILNNMAKEASNAGAKFVDSMYGSANTMNKFAESMGRQNVQQTLAAKRAENAAGGPLSQESKQFSTEFLQSEAGKGLLQDAKFVVQTRGTQGRNQAITNQLLRGIVTKSITAEEARAIAIDIGTQLNDQSIGIKIGAQINRLAGPNGEDITKNLLNINAIITPKIDAQEAQKIVNEQWQNTGLLSKFAMIITGRGTDDMLAKTIAVQASQAAQITTEQLDLLKLELEQNLITYQEFITKKEVLTKQSFDSTTNAMATLIQQFNNDADKATNAIKAFRDEINKGFEIKISGLDEADRKKINDFINSFEYGGQPPTGIQPLGTQNSQIGPGITQTQTGFQTLGTTGIAPLGTQTQVGFQQPPTFQKVNENQSDIIKQLADPNLILALSKIEGMDVNKKLADIVGTDAAALSTMQDYFTMGGDLSIFLEKSAEEIKRYSTELDRLSGVQEKFKTGRDLTTLILNPDELSAFTKEASKAQETIDALARQKNLTKEMALNIITTYSGDDANAKKLLEHYLSTGNKFEDLNLDALVTMSVANPEVANALKIVELAKSGAAVGMTAIAGAYNVLATAGERAGTIPTGGTTSGAGDGTDIIGELRKSIEETNKELVAKQKLRNQGTMPELIATLDSAKAIALATGKRKELIKALEEQLAKQRVIASTGKTDEELSISVLNEQINLRDRAIDSINREISAIQRKNELDQREIGIRQRSLDQLSKKESEVNKVYDLRSKSLDEVSKINDRLAQQQQDRISLASALTSGDFGAAAQAAAGMTSNFAATQIEDAKSALEQQRQKDIEALTISVNGQLMTRQQIQAQIDVIEERIYQRNQSIIPLQDQIYTKELEKQDLQIQINDLNDQIRLRMLAQEQSIARQIGATKTLKDYYQNIFDIAKATAAKNWSFKLGEKNTGGEIKKAFGGTIFKGSKEAPPAIKMAYGSLVPGMGITDKVPALLTPGEFVVRKSAAQANLPLLNAINSNVFPKGMSGGMSDIKPVESTTAVSNVSAPVYNYSVSVNVSDTNASPNDIADVVINKIKMSQNRQIRGNRF